jgi:tetratricopeptide (TPR) repeat protein
MRLPAVLIFALALALFPSWQEEAHHHALTEQEIGSVHFSTSCSTALESSFNGAVALLHSFQYEQARQAFVDISSKDPGCAMAQWGVAMSHYHGLWGNGDPVAGRNAIHKAEQIAAANPKTTAREVGYIDALSEIYREGDKNRFADAHAFEQKMAALQAAYPADDEAAIFHALTLDIAAPPTDKTFANQRKCGEILEPIFAKYPHHPGVAHYIIHCYDNPVLARQGLAAARVYAKIAPASAHANHMPSHIFTRLGLWDESISSNLKSAELAAHAEPTSLNGEARDQRLHAMDYLEYAYLQTGRVKLAKGVLDQMSALQPVAGLTLTGDYAMAAIPARYAMELGDWDQASGLKVRKEGVPWAQAITWTAIGVGSARSGNLVRASQAEKTLASLRDATAKQNNTYWSSQIEVQRLEVAAWIAEKSSKGADALSTIRAAAELEESMNKDAVTPGAVTPAREMFAQMLYLENHPRQSLAEYQAVLQIAPNRFNALYGAGCAAEAAGNTTASHKYFQQLIQVAVGSERPELLTARKRVVTTRSKGRVTLRGTSRGPLAATS